MIAATTPVGCVEYATAVLGDKWTPILLRHFLNESTVRFCQLQELTGGINPRTLSARLSELEENGIIMKSVRGSINRCEYSLTEKGQDLMPILHDMQQWSAKYAPQTVSQI